MSDDVDEMVADLGDRLDSMSEDEFASFCQLVSDLPWSWQTSWGLGLLESMREHDAND